MDRYSFFWFAVVIDFKVANGINDIHAFDDLSKDSIFGITSWLTTFFVGVNDRFWITSIS